MKEFTIVRSLFDNRKRQLVIDDNFIKFEHNDHRENSFITINKEDIAGIRYGIHFIKGYRFYIGREYQIFIRDKDNKETKIYFKLFYKRKLNEKHQLFVDIINDLWEKYFDDILNSYFEKLENKESFELAGIKILSDRIQFNKKEVLFDDLDIKKYYHYFMIYSKQDNYNNKMLYHLKDKDAIILRNLLTHIIKNE
jgi:DNA-directed RNA polymerase subunit N (RpoN/RPB10)